MKIADLLPVGGGLLTRTAINARFQAIVAALQNTVSLDGSLPNEMQTDFSLGDHRLINVQDGVASSDAATIAQLARLAVPLNGPVSTAALANPAAGFGSDMVSNVVEAADFLSRGAQGDGVVNDTAAINAAINSERKSLFADDNKKFLVTALNNPLGKEILGKGPILKTITGGVQQLNTYADFDKYAIGKEYLYPVYQRLRTVPTQVVGYTYGDSTVFGVGLFTSDMLLQNLLPRLARHSGWAVPFNVTNRGVSGTSIDSFNAIPDLGANTDIIFVKYGINDAASQPEATRLNYYATTLRSKLAAIRSQTFGTIANLAIVLVGPNSTSDTPNNRDERWYEQLRGIYVQAARDYQCAYFDTYAYLKDSRPAAGLWMDNPYGDGRAIHGNDIMQGWIWGGIWDWAFARAETDQYRVNNFQNLGSLHGNALPTTLPGSYETGITVRRAIPGNGWPKDGAVLTMRHSDGSFAYQINWGNDNSGITYFRTGNDALGWSAFQLQGLDVSNNIAVAAGYTLPGGMANMRTARYGNQICIEGYVNKSAPAIIPTNTAIGSVAGGYEPIVDSLYGINLTVFDGGTGFETVPGRILSNGQILTLKATSITAARVYAMGAWSRANNT